MKKIFKVLLVVAMMIVFVGCGSKNKSQKDIEEALAQKDYYVQRLPSFSETSDVSMSLILQSEGDSKGMVSAAFDSDKSLLFAFYGEGTEMYFVAGDEKYAEVIGDDLKDEYDSWLKDVDLTSENVIDYLTAICKEVRTPEQIAECIEDCHFEYSFEPMADSERNLYLESSKGYFSNANFDEEGNIERFIFASSIASTADKLFVYQNGKVTKSDGVNSYLFFLQSYNISHEEFMNYLQDYYQTNKK